MSLGSMDSFSATGAGLALRHWGYGGFVEGAVLFGEGGQGGGGGGDADEGEGEEVGEVGCQLHGCPLVLVLVGLLAGWTCVWGTAIWQD